MLPVEVLVARRWNWMETALVVAVLGIGGLVTLLTGLHVYFTSTAETLHRDTKAIPSAMAIETPPTWATAVARAQQAVREHLASRNLPGISVAVGVGDQVVWAEGFGYADLEARRPLTPEARFRLGTASTVLTSAAAGLLVEKGALRLEAPIETYVPDWPRKEWPVTLAQVMGHTAGLRPDGGDESPLYGMHCESPTEAVASVVDGALRDEPGTRYGHSNYSWIVVSAAIERAAGEPFLRVMREQVFAPLGMRDTTTDGSTAEAADTDPRSAASYFPRYSADPRYGLHDTRPIDLSCYAGAGVFVTTPGDLVRFGLGLQSGRLLTPDTLRLLQTSQRLRSGEATGYGLGWDLETVTLNGDPVTVVGHDGDVLGGMVASLMVVRERGLVVAVMSNISYAETSSLAASIADAFVAGAAPGDPSRPGPQSSGS